MIELSPKELEIKARVSDETILAQPCVLEAISEAEQHGRDEAATAVREAQKALADVEQARDGLRYRLDFLMTGSEQPDDVMERFQRVAGRRGEYVWRGSLESGAWEFSPFKTPTSVAPL